MDRIDKEDNRAEHEIILEELASKLTLAPDSWILFLGNDLSGRRAESCTEVLSELANQILYEGTPAASVARGICQAVQEKKYEKLSSILFGNIWDESSFLDADKERNIQFREAYGEKLRGRNEIDVHEVNERLHLQELIGKFCGIILTTFQDDTVEAFWEYEHSLPADSIVYIPQYIENSNDWRRWLHATPEEIAYLKSQSESLEKTTILVKLFGSKDKPAKMLLSKEDMEEFYPPRVKGPSDSCAEGNNINTICFLEKIFHSKNILFIGVDFENDWLLKAAEGILELLGKEPAAGVERYTLLCKGFDAEKYHTRTIGDIQENDKSVLEILSKKMGDRQVDCSEGCTEKIDEEIPLQSQKEILRYFSLFYNRHPQKFFLQKGQHDVWGTYNAYAAEEAVLKRDILGFRDNDENSQRWNRKNIRQLAIAANNFSDFYDLRDAMELVKVTEGEPHETTIQNLLDSRFSKKGVFLHQILQRYESGFPIGFLQLLPREKYSLKAWGRAAIQLANSGVYIQRHGKQRLYERLSYADCVMRTAGRSPFQARICNEIDAIPYQSMYGYLYPFHKVEIQNGQEIESQEIDDHFTKMFCTLYDILRNKSEEYQEIHSLLQTELSSIVKMMRILPDEKLKWKPGLLYYLLKESRMSVEGEELLDYCSSLEQECIKLKSFDGEETPWRLFDEELMLYQSKALIMSQSSKEDEQRMAADECSKVENAVLEADRLQTLWKEVIPGQIFEHRIYALFLRGMIFGRMSTIREIERCKDKAAECTEQASLLAEMKNCLDCAERLIKEREDVIGEEYRSLRSELARQMGEYYFKMSQYHGENRRYAKKDEWSDEVCCYRQSEEMYMEALKHYNCSPVRYAVQCADTMRNIADMYCQWARSVAEMSAEGQSACKNYNELIEQCYENLINAYVIYRHHFDIHGTADVMQSMGQVEGYNSTEENGQRCRSRLCYYKGSMDMYQDLGDAWSAYVVSSFLEDAIKCSSSSNGNVDDLVSGKEIG